MRYFIVKILSNTIDQKCDVGQIRDLPTYSCGLVGLGLGKKN